MEILRLLADNQQLFEAVQKTIEDEFALEDIDTRTMPNDRIGEVVRARLEGLKKVQSAFNRIGKYKTTANRADGKNPAR